MHLSRALGACSGVLLSSEGEDSGFGLWAGGGLWGVEDCLWSGM